MKKITLLLVTLSLFLCPPIYGDIPDRVDGEGYLSWAFLFVTADQNVITSGEDPWSLDINKLEHSQKVIKLEEVPLHEHWFRLSEHEPIILNSKGKIKFVVAFMTDWKVETASPLSVNINKDAKTMELLIKLKRWEGIIEAIYRLPSLWKTDAIVKNVQPGTYRVYLHKTFVGDLQVVK